MKLIIYPRLHPESKRALRRRKKSWGHNYTYNPRPDLVKRLAAELNWTEQEVRNQINLERAYFVPFQLME